MGQCFWPSTEKLDEAYIDWNIGLTMRELIYPLCFRLNIDIKCLLKQRNLTSDLFDMPKIQANAIERVQCRD